ncbi:GntR family transcriptional regulator [Methylobacterium sp. C25]|uniref:GntR family transcriptional regulator n=1 Tax=Methylobacterium sp. C25 TaxID=2721622 RepID=UPI001F428727|nr:GntR family transcriptional regulator [Methylobacterium sp. C25]MCE4224529.1 GntR family transcriptional regulator [Methylobacterium sp. C25]
MASVPATSRGGPANLIPITVEPSLRSLAYKALKSAITDLEIYDRPDEIRLDERKLSVELGVSRTPVREALTILEHQGFVRAEPRRGIYVIRKSKGEIVDMIHACAALEAMAVRLACQRATDEQLGALRNEFGAFYETDRPTEFEIYFEARWRFCRHVAILAQTGEILAMLDHLLLHLRSVHDVFFRRKTKPEYLRAAYVAIIAALEHRDADHAAQLVRERG